MKIKRYSKKSEYSFCFGAIPVMDLLKEKREKVLKVLFKEEGLEDAEVKKAMDFVKKEGVDFEIAGRVIEKISSKENTYVVGVFEKYGCEINKKKNHVVLVNPKNPGNVGTIMRNMVAFGVNDLVLIKPAVDVFHPSVVRSAMGSMFFVNFKYYSSFEEYADDFKDHNIYSFMLGAKKEISEVSFKGPFSLVFGNEGRGLEKKFLKIGQPVFIPHSEFVDSLNLSMSVGIALYVACK